MKRILLVLAFVLLSSLLFAQVDPDPQATADGSTNGDTTMYWYWYTLRTQGDVQSPLQNQQQQQLIFAKGANEEWLGPMQEGGLGEPQRLQAQKQSGDCDGDCDGEPDKDRLQDGSCGDGGDGPDKEPGGKGY